MNYLLEESCALASKQKQTAVRKGEFYFNMAMMATTIAAQGQT